MIIIGGLTAVLATALLAGAAFLYWVDGKRDAGGFFTTGAVHMATSTYAITSDDLDIKEGVLAFVGADGSSGARLRVRSNKNTPIFVGVAYPMDVDDYLRDSAHETLTGGRLRAVPADVPHGERRSAAHALPPRRPSGRRPRRAPGRRRWSGTSARARRRSC